MIVIPVGDPGCFEAFLANRPQKPEPSSSRSAKAVRWVKTRWQGRNGIILNELFEAENPPLSYRTK